MHLDYEDAEAFAAWTGKDLPTEAEWELAARGGLDGAVFTWGRRARATRRAACELLARRLPLAIGSGVRKDHTGRLLSSEPYGLHDMAGNVWEWTADWYAARHPGDADKPCCVPRNPRGGALEGSFDSAQSQFPVPRKVIKGGSYLCAESYCRRYRPAARRPQMIDTGMSHIGFRCVVRRGRNDAPT